MYSHRIIYKESKNMFATNIRFSVILLLKQRVKTHVSRLRRMQRLRVLH